MAQKKGNTGPLRFRMSEADLLKHMEKYKEKVRSGETYRASWSGFCSSLGYTEDDVRAVLERGLANDGSTYYPLSLRLKEMLTWFRGELTSSEAWCKQPQLAAFLLRQDYGDGYAYSNKEQAAEGPKDLVIRFDGAEGAAD